MPSSLFLFHSILSLLSPLVTAEVAYYPGSKLTFSIHRSPPLHWNTETHQHSFAFQQPPVSFESCPSSFTPSHLAVMLCDPRQSERTHAQYIVENLVLASYKWNLRMLNVYVLHGQDRGGWTEDVWRDSLTCLQRSSESKMNSEQGSEGALRVFVLLMEMPYTNFHWFEYSYVIKTGALWHYIANHVCSHTSHILFIQYDTSLSLDAKAPSLADFGTKYDYVGCPGMRGSWLVDVCNETNTPPDGVCSLIGGLSLRSLRYILRGMEKIPPPNAAKETLKDPPFMFEDMYFMSVIMHAGGKMPKDMFARRFCRQQLVVPNPFGYHKTWNSYTPKYTLGTNPSQCVANADLSRLSSWERKVAARLKMLS